MKKNIFFLIIFFFLFLSCEKNKVISSIPQEYIGKWQGEINLELIGKTKSIFYISKDSLKMTYEKFGDLYEINFLIEKIEIQNSQKCTECNENVLTICYKTINDENNNFTPYVDKFWLSNKIEGNFNYLYIDQSILYDGEVKELIRIK